jgi:hypothetical protein
MSIATGQLVPGRGDITGGPAAARGFYITSGQTFYIMELQHRGPRVLSVEISLLWSKFWSFVFLIFRLVLQDKFVLHQL